MANKKPFIANKNHFYIFGGIFLCLVTLILCLNTGIVARYASTPFTYVFGTLSYVVYIAVNLLGLRFIFAKKLLKIKLNIYFFATLVLLVAGIILFAHFVSLNYLADGGQYLALSTNAELKTINFADCYGTIFDGVQGGYFNVTSLGLSLIRLPLVLSAIS